MNFCTSYEKFKKKFNVSTVFNEKITRIKLKINYIISSTTPESDMRLFTIQAVYVYILKFTL